MKRRNFIVGLGTAAAVWPLSANSQSGRKPVVGVLFHSNPEPLLGLLRAALARLGYRVGETIELDVRDADGSDARLSELAADLVARRVDVIFASTTPSAIAAKAATTAIPIVISSADAVGSGLVANLARPGGNLTGMSLAIPEIAGNLLALLREALPSAGRLGLLVNGADPFHRRLIEGVEAANFTVKVDLGIFRVSKPDELEPAFARMLAERIDAAIVQPTLPRATVIALGMRYKLPTASPIAGFARQGGFLSYSGRTDELSAVIAAQIDQILKGGRPADIPVRQPARFAMVLNLKTAAALGVTIPPLLLAQADEVIE
jgi:putative ABC transport system substrate-binding protein